MRIQNPDGSGLAENLKEEIKTLREEISSKRLIIKILAENINNHENLDRIILFIMIFIIFIMKSKSCTNNLSNTPEKDFNIRNNFVEDKNARSNKAKFINFNIATTKRFGNLCLVENTHNDAKIDDVTEIDVSMFQANSFCKVFKK